MGWAQRNPKETTAVPQFKLRSQRLVQRATFDPWAGAAIDAHLVI